MDKDTADRELRFIRDVMDRTHRRIDPRGFHFVHWGLIVLVWYPIANFLEHQGEFRWMATVGIGSVVLGFVLSGVREAVLARRAPRLQGENTFITRQVSLIVAGCVVMGMTLSAVIPQTAVIPARDIPTIWGLVYAIMAYMTGVAYSRDFLVAGCAIFVGVIAAIIWPLHNGYILGPVMGFGMLIPGIRAELRVRRMMEATS